MGKHIKVDMRSAAQKAAVQAPTLAPIPDLIVQFASNEKVYFLRVPSAEMGNVARMIGKVCEKYGIKYTLEEKLR